MSDERDDKEPTAGAPPSPQVGVWKQEDGPPSGADAEPIPFLGEAIAQASQRWLRDRFGLVEDAEGALHVPEAQRWPDLGQRAEQFVRGFFRGFVEKSPEEREAAYGLRAAGDVPPSTALVGRLLERFSNTVTDTWNGYIAEHAEARGEGGERVVDGAFVVAHGASLIGTMISRLGEAFEDVGLPGGTSIHEGHYDPPSSDDGDDDAAQSRSAAHDVAEAEAAGGSPGPAAAAPKIHYDVDLGSIFRALFSPRS